MIEYRVLLLYYDIDYNCNSDCFTGKERQISSNFFKTVESAIRFIERDVSYNSEVKRTEWKKDGKYSYLIGWTGITWQDEHAGNQVEGYYRYVIEEVTVEDPKSYVKVLASEKKSYHEVTFKYNDKEYKGYLLDCTNLSRDFDSEHHDVCIILVPELMTIFRREEYSSRGGDYWDDVKTILDFSSEIKPKVRKK